MKRDNITNNYYNKWQGITKCTERINEEKTANAIKIAYSSVGIKRNIEIHFFDSPNAVNREIKNVYKSNIITYNIHNLIRRKLVIEPKISISDQLKRSSVSIKQAKSHSSFLTTNQLQLLSKVSIQFWSRYAWFFDYAYSTLDVKYDRIKWKALQDLIKYCGYILPFQDICFVSDRPTELLFKDDYILHAEDKPAVVFRDGYKIFACNGVELSTTL